MELISNFVKADVGRSERNNIIKTIAATHFTDLISQYDIETESLEELSDNKVFIRSVNIQSIQPLKFRLAFWNSASFADTDLDEDSENDDVVLDMSDIVNAWRISNANQYYLNISDLNISYEDEDETKKLHLSLQNLSPIDKAAGSSGSVKLKIKYAPRQ